MIDCPIVRQKWLLFAIMKSDRRENVAKFVAQALTPRLDFYAKYMALLCGSNSTKFQN